MISVLITLIILTPNSPPHSPSPLQTPLQVVRIQEMIKDNFLFKKLDESQRSSIIKGMQLKEVKPDEVVIREGEDGDEMYLVDR